MRTCQAVDWLVGRLRLGHRDASSRLGKGNGMVVAGAQLDFANEHVCGCVPAGQSADWLAVDVLGRLSHEHGVVLSSLGKGKSTVGAGAVGTIRWRSVVHSVYALNGLLALCLNVLVLLLRYGHGSTSRS